MLILSTETQKSLPFKEMSEGIEFQVNVISFFLFAIVMKCWQKFMYLKENKELDFIFLLLIHLKLHVRFKTILSFLNYLGNVLPDEVVHMQEQIEPEFDVLQPIGKLSS